MKWNEMSVFHKAVSVVGFLCGAAFVIVSLLGLFGILEDVNAITSFLCCVFLLSQGIRCWNTRRKLAIFSFILVGLYFLLHIVDLFV